MLGGTGEGGSLTEVRMDATLSGEYRGLVQLINALERDRMFFLINGVTLSGQQSGTVGLRLGLTTYLRTAGPGETADGSSVVPVLTEPVVDVVNGGPAR